MASDPMTKNAMNSIRVYLYAAGQAIRRAGRVCQVHGAESKPPRRRKQGACWKRVVTHDRIPADHGAAVTGSAKTDEKSIGKPRPKHQAAVLPDAS